MRKQPGRQSNRALLMACVGVMVVALAGLGGWHPLGAVRAIWLKQGTGPIASDDAEGLSTIQLSREVLHPGVTHFGINLSGQTFYDSGMMLRNLVSRNPGFEGETWQSILHCDQATSLSCTDESPDLAWPAGFLNGATYEVLNGNARGSSGIVISSTAANHGAGMTVAWSAAAAGLVPGAFVVVRMEKPGGAEAGWWTSLHGGATVATELHDLSPATAGQQALHLSAGDPGQMADVSSYFDSTAGHSFLQLHGRYALRFRAKRLSGEPVFAVSFSRTDKSPGNHRYFAQTVPLTPTWNDFTYQFPASEDGHARGTLALTFSASRGDVLLDDVELVAIDGNADNPTDFRDEVVDTLRGASPGIIRFMDNGTSFGSTLNDLLRPQLARRRAGSLYRTSLQEDIPIGLHEALTLARAVGADPWFTLPATFSTLEATQLIEYLAGPPTSPFGALRASRGEAAPWTSVFRQIHLELGNEMWNAGTYGGASLANPEAYGMRVGELFGAMRRSPYFQAAGYDLVMGAQAENTWLTPEELRFASQQDSIAFAPYLFGQFNDASSIEAIYGAMFAEPELEDMTGVMAQQVEAARRASSHTQPAVYEVNLGTSGSSNDSVTQADLERTVASVGGGIAVLDHMLLMLRDLGIRSQCLFALPEFANQFVQPGDRTKTVPLWGSVVDMGGATNRRRPTYLALEVVNHALLTDELAMRLTGANPTWNQAASTNDSQPPSHPHELQVFAFGDRQRRSMVLINLSRTKSHPVSFSGPDAPSGNVSQSLLTAAHLTDTNEHEELVTIKHTPLSSFHADIPYSLPPFSITVLEWQVAR